MIDQEVPTTIATGSFEQSCAEVLSYLHARTKFGLWMVTRVEGDDWIVLAAEDHHYGVRPGEVLSWRDSFCSRMVSGEGPCIAPKAAEIPAYAAAPIGRRVPINAYIGYPLRLQTGELFGTLCGIDPQGREESLQSEAELLNLLTGLLSRIIHLELAGHASQRKMEEAVEESERDQLTGLLNRRGWERVTAAEEARCRRYGSPASVIIADLDGLKQMNDTQGHEAGDAMLRKVGEILRSVGRSHDRTARTGGDEFAVLLPDSRAEDAAHLAARIVERLEGEEIGISLGVAARDPRQTLGDAIARADEAMYANKRIRKGSQSR